MHTRRTLLQFAGLTGVVGLSGCAGIVDGSTEEPLPDGGSGDGGSDDGNGSGDGGTKPSDRQRPADATHEATITGSDDAPDLPVAPHVSLANPYVTGGQPIVLRIDVENTTDAAVVIGEYRPIVFQYVTSAGGTLVWYPHSERSTTGEPDRAVPDLELAGEGCWRLDSGIAQTMEYGTVEIPANGTLTAFVGLYALPEATAVGSCFPVGDFRFDTNFTVFEDGLGGDENESAAWGFDLSVETVDGGRTE